MSLSEEINDFLTGLQFDYDTMIEEVRPNPGIKGPSWEVMDIILVNLENDFREKMEYLANFWIDNQKGTISKNDFNSLINYLKWLPKYLPQKYQRVFEGWVWRHGYQFCKSENHTSKPVLLPQSEIRCFDCQKQYLINHYKVNKDVESLYALIDLEPNISEPMKTLFYSLWSDNILSLNQITDSKKQKVLFHHILLQLDVDSLQKNPDKKLLQRLEQEAKNISPSYQQAINYLLNQDLFVINDICGIRFLGTSIAKKISEMIDIEIHNLDIMELIRLYRRQPNHKKKLFYTDYISQRLGGIKLDSSQIRNISLKDSQHFAASLGWTAEGKPYTKILGLDIGTFGKNLQGCSSEERRKRIKESHLVNIGWHWNGGQGSYVDSKKPYREKLDALREQLTNAEILVGYNLFDFDLLVLKDKGLDVEEEFPNLKIYDLMSAIYKNHVYVRESLSNLLIQNNLPEKDTGSNRGLAAQHDAQATIGCFNLLVFEGLKYGKIKLRTDLLTGINKLRDIDHTKNIEPDLLSLWTWKAHA